MSIVLSKVKLVSVFILTGSLSMAASAYFVDPGSEDYKANDVGYTNATCEPGCINTLFSQSYDNSNLIYRINADGNVEEGSHSGSYSFEWNSFDNQAYQYSGGSLMYNPLNPVACEGIACYLVVKDGRNEPYQYFYDISDWNGTDTINFSGFWTGSGSISHISIWGGTSVPVPEPATALLLATGIFGLVASRKRAK